MLFYNNIVKLESIIVNRLRQAKKWPKLKTIFCRTVN